MPGSSKRVSKRIELEGPKRVVINADGEFHIHKGDSDGKKAERIGPDVSVSRSFVFDVDSVSDHFWIDCVSTVKWSMKVLDLVNHKEFPDPTPIEIPIGYSKPLTLREDMRRFIREEYSAHAAQQGEETFEEADDFDIGDADEAPSPYELFDMIEEFVPDEQEKDTPAKGDTKVDESAKAEESAESESQPLAKAAKPV